METGLLITPEGFAGKADKGRGSGSGGGSGKEGRIGTSVKENCHKMKPTTTERKTSRDMMKMI